MTGNGYLSVPFYIWLFIDIFKTNDPTNYFLNTLSSGSYFSLDQTHKFWNFLTMTKLRQIKPRKKWAVFSQFKPASHQKWAALHLTTWSPGTRHSTLDWPLVTTVDDHRLKTKRQWRHRGHFITWSWRVMLSTLSMAVTGYIYRQERVKKCYGGQWQPIKIVINSPTSSYSWMCYY